MLFSEPKISQLLACAHPAPRQRVSVLFSEPKISQYNEQFLIRTPALGFSALQRAENFSIRGAAELVGRAGEFQCSSASRKFLNFSAPSLRVVASPCFSALQRAENFSIRILPHQSRRPSRVSVLFSEPKISQFLREITRRVRHLRFQCSSASRKFLNQVGKAVHIKRWLLFQCSSASRKFLNLERNPAGSRRRVEFQCSSASRKFLNAAKAPRVRH